MCAKFIRLLKRSPHFKGGE